MSDTSGKICFVSMPSGVKIDLDSGNAVDFDTIYQLIISPAAHAAGYSAVKADDALTQLDQVIDLITTADLFIGDLSTNNPNVYYEVGLRHMTSMPCLLIASKDAKIPFDVAWHRVLRYSDLAEFSADRDRLAASISALEGAGPHAGSPISRDRLRAIISDSPTTRAPTFDVLPQSIQESLSSVERRLYGLEAKLSTMVEEIASQRMGAHLRKPGGKPSSRRVFVVHGRSDIADSLRTQVCSFLLKLKLEPVVLREQAEGGRALPHKLDEEMSDVEYAFVLLTPDDIGAHKSEEDKLRPRARQNVVYEHGLFVGRLGLPRICVIRMSDVELPSDLSGMIPKLINAGEPLDRLYLDLVRELRSAGYEVDANYLFS
jgi:predicted nucleotide-binding protein